MIDVGRYLEFRQHVEIRARADEHRAGIVEVRLALRFRRAQVVQDAVAAAQENDRAAGDERNGLPDPEARIRARELGILLDRVPLRTLQAAGWLLFCGVLLFCGSLYLLLAGAPRLVGVLTPLGGLALIAAWCLAAVALGSRAAASDQR